MNRFAPDETEASALRRTAKLQSRFVGTAIACMTIALSARFIPNAVIQLALPVGAVLAMIGFALYLALGLRCPRCSGWIPPASSAGSRCTSCGMNLHVGSRAADGRG